MKGKDMEYKEFLARKQKHADNSGFDPLWMPDFLFDFQQYLVDWALRKGRAAIFADCGMGKTPMSLVWAQNVNQKTNKPVLIVAPLAVSQQFIGEAEKFGINAVRSREGQGLGDITVTNYGGLWRHRVR
jgi:superfamily II DNA or RNA helicase